MASTLQAVVKYADDAAGLEKSLRLLQALFQVIGGLASTAADAAPWLHARSQLALGRRYFRLHKWQPCFAAAVDQFHAPQPAWRMMLQVLKFSLVGVYFFLEAWTITNAMGVTNYAWAPMLQHEANKCWGYSIALSILITLIDLATASAGSESKTGKEKQQGGARSSKRETRVVDLPRARLYKQLVIDVCDITIPGSSVGWMALDPVTVGVMQSISSAVAGREIWMRVQA